MAKLTISILLIVSIKIKIMHDVMIRTPDDSIPNTTPLMCQLIVIRLMNSMQVHGKKNATCIAQNSTAWQDSTFQNWLLSTSLLLLESWFCLFEKIINFQCVILSHYTSPSHWIEAIMLMCSLVHYVVVVRKDSTHLHNNTMHKGFMPVAWDYLASNLDLAPS